MRTTEDSAVSGAARENGGNGDEDTDAWVEGADLLRPHANIEAQIYRDSKPYVGSYNILTCRL
jgi:hypothetical protein